ncbi:MAG: hypothetical protein Q9197_002571 [Variospora fuerteventurae]
MNHHQLALATVITLIRSTRAASPPCYSPAGQKLPGYGVCDPRLAASVCCGAGDICLSNGLCSNKSNEFYRGGCSDNLYKSGLCPSFCINEPLTAFISVCDRNGGAGGIYLCCDAGRKRGTCCRNETEVFNLAAPFSSITAGPASATNPAVADDNDFSREPTSTSSGTLTYILQKTIKANPVSTQQASPPTDPPSPAATAADKPHPPNIGTIAGAATGASLLLLSLAFLLYCIHRRRRHRRRSHSKRPTIRVLKPSDDDQHELPSSDDPTQRQNSLLFPAELVSKPSRVPVVAELEIKESLSSSSEVPPSSTTTTTTTKDPVELSSSSDQSPRPRGPFELQSSSSRDNREMDIVDDDDDGATAAAAPAAAVTVVPPTPVENEQSQHIIIPRSSSHYSRDNTGWEAEEAEDDDNGGLLQSPPPPSSFRARSSSSRPDSLSGPWHDTYDDDEKKEKAVFF